MKNIRFYILMLPICTFFCNKSAEANQPQILENYGKIPLAFTINKDKCDLLVKFTTNGGGYTMFFTQNGTIFKNKTIINTI